MVRALENLTQMHGKPQRLLMDNGPEFTSMALDQWAYDNGVRLQFAGHLDAAALGQILSAANALS